MSIPSQGISRYVLVSALGALLLLTGARAATALDVPLTVKETAGVGATGHPAQAVVPLARGAYQDTTRFRVVAPDGRTVPAQFETLSRWWAQDRSLRHVLVHFQPTVGAFTTSGTGAATYRLLDDGGNPAPTQPVSVSETPGAITIETGATTITVQKSPFRIVTPAGPIDATVTGRTDVQRSFDRTDVTVSVEESGPMRVVLRAEAPTLYTDPANHTHGWAVRLYVYAGKPWLKLDYQLQNSAKTKVYAAPFYFRSVALSRPGGVPATVRYGAEMRSAVTPSAVELIPAANAWANGLYWLDDMRHVVFETMYWLGGTPQAQTFQLPPIVTLPTTWYAATRGTLDMGGIVPRVDPDVKTDRRRPSPVDAGHTGWDNFWIDLDRKMVPSAAGNYAYSGSKWIATEDPADVFEAERFALGELNVRPQWMAQYDHVRDWPTLQLSANPYAGVSWRKYLTSSTSTLGDQKLDAAYLPGTGRTSTPRDDQHGWFYHVEEAYWATGNPWIRDWYQFVGEFRRVFVERKDPWPDDSSRAIGHALSHALQAYRVTGKEAIRTGVRAYIVGSLKSSILSTGGRSSGTIGGVPFESAFMMGYMTRALVSYVEEAGGDAETEAMIRSFVGWNVANANFGYNVNPYDPNLNGVSSGTALTMVDPQAWAAWKYADTAALDHVTRYIATGLNGGGTPYADFSRWTGDFAGRVIQLVRDGAAPPPPPSSPPPPPPPSVVDTTPPTVSLTAPLNGATVAGTVTVTASAADNVGVAGVRFFLDGAPLGAELTTPPYGLSWPTTAVANGVHTITAEARDAAGNQMSSAATVTVDNTASPPPSPVPPPPSALPAIPTNSWYEIPGSQAKQALPNPWPAGAGYAESMMVAWSGGYWDSRRQELGVAGGGHSDGALNLVIAFNLQSLAWRRVTEPSIPWASAAGSTQSTNPDGTPVARHTYGGLQYMPNADRVWMKGSGNWFNGGGDPITWLLDPGTRSWQRGADAPNAYDMTSGFDPVKGEVIYKANSGIFAYHPVTNTTRRLNSTWDSLEADYAGAVDVVGRYFYLIGRGEMRRVALDQSGPVPVERVTTTGATGIQAMYQPGFVYDPDSRRLVAWNGGADLYTLDLTAASPVWVRQTLGGTPPGAAAHSSYPTGTFGRFQYIGGGRVIVVSGISENVFVGQIGAAQTPPPPPPPAPVIWTLTVTTQGNGSVTSSPAGIACAAQATCAGSYAAGTVVTLTATPGTGATFTGWSGACTGAGTCAVTLDAATSVTATFTTTYSLSVTKTGSGSVTSAPAGVACGATCAATYTSGTSVTLTATPAGGWAFKAWSGACTGTARSCTVTMTAAKSMTATFVPKYTLTVTLTGSGLVTSTPAGISCGTDCKHGFARGTSVTLAAAPSSQYVFVKWTRGCTGTGTCVVTMTKHTSVGAVFQLR